MNVKEYMAHKGAAASSYGGFGNAIGTTVVQDVVEIPKSIVISTHLFELSITGHYKTLHNNDFFITITARLGGVGIFEFRRNITQSGWRGRQDAVDCINCFHIDGDFKLEIIEFKEI